MTLQTHGNSFLYGVNHFLTIRNDLGSLYQPYRDLISLIYTRSLFLFNRSSCEVGFCELATNLLCLILSPAMNVMYWRRTETFFGNVSPFDWCVTRIFFIIRSSNMMTSLIWDEDMIFVTKENVFHSSLSSMFTSLYVCNQYVWVYVCNRVMRLYTEINDDVEFSITFRRLVVYDER